MQTFTDTQGRLWTVKVTIGTIKDIREVLDIDILDPQIFFRQIQDPIALCNILFVACRSQCDAVGVSDVEFGHSLGGSALRDAKNAIVEAYINFTPNPEAVPRLRELADRMDRIGDRILATISKKMPAITEAIDREIETAVQAIEADIDRKISGSSSTSSPGSRESIPDP